MPKLNIKIYTSKSKLTKNFIRKQIYVREDS